MKNDLEKAETGKPITLKSYAVIDRKGRDTGKRFLRKEDAEKYQKTLLEIEDKKFFREMYGQLLDYVDDYLISNCAEWGYDAYKKYLTQKNLQSNNPLIFIIAATTAVIIGHFGYKAYNDHFDEEGIIELNPLDLDFEQVRQFINQDIRPERLEILEESDTVGLQDIWDAIWEYNNGIYKTLLKSYQDDKSQEPEDQIFSSLLRIHKEDEDGRKVRRNITDANELSAHSFICGGFLT
ncbi:MAG: hypothetical protein WC435_00755 [Candidatus Paceibacterota bacterium]